MKKIIWGVRTLAREMNVTRDTIRFLIDARKIEPSVLKKRGSMHFVFDEKEIRKVEELLGKKKRAYTKKPSS